MALNEPRPKKHCKLNSLPPLPLIYSSSNEIHKFKGVFNDVCVEINDENDMKNMVGMGYFGKATLSRTYPQFSQRKPEIVRNRVYQNRKKWGDKFKNAPQKVIVLPDSESDENEDYFNNLQPRYEIDCSGIKENVNLSLEESFFLCSAIECLDIYYEEKLLDVASVWELFKQSDKYFVQNYVAYYHFRSKNWVVKTGIKFGGDFLLYKQGPPFYHASYVVIISIVDENLKKIEDLNRHSMKTVNLMGLDRLCETAGKELLICEIIWPNCPMDQQISFKDLAKFSVKEIIMKRWQPSQEKDIENE